MTKKDYIAIAGALRDARPIAPPHQSQLLRECHRMIDGCAESIADACQRDNPKFDRARFLTACGVQS